jgi:hypothetical protein
MRNTIKNKLFKKSKNKRTRRIKGGVVESTNTYGNNSNTKYVPFDNAANSIINNADNLMSRAANITDTTRNFYEASKKMSRDINDRTNAIYQGIETYNGKYKKAKPTRAKIEEKVFQMFEPGVWKQLTPIQKEEIVTSIQKLDENTLSKLIELMNNHPQQIVTNTTCEKPASTFSNVSTWFGNGLSSSKSIIKDWFKSKKMPRMNDKLVVKLLRSSTDPDKFGGYVIYNPRIAIPLDVGIRKSMRSVDDMLYEVQRDDSPTVFDTISLDITDQTQSKTSNNLQKYSKLSKELTGDNRDINKQDLNGNTLLTLACKGKDLNIIFDLIQTGAILTIKDKESIANNDRFKDISEYIIGFIEEYNEKMEEGNIDMKKPNMKRLFQSWCDKKGKCANKINSWKK